MVIFVRPVFKSYMLMLVLRVKRGIFLMQEVSIHFDLCE